MRGCFWPLSCLQQFLPILVTPANLWHFAIFRGSPCPFPLLSVEYYEICYSCYFCPNPNLRKKILVTFAIFAKFADISKPFLTFSLSKCRILWNLLFLLFLPYLLLNIFTYEKKFLLLLRFLRNLRTSRSPSWPFLSVKVEFWKFVIPAIFAIFVTQSFYIATKHTQIDITVFCHCQ